MWAYHQQMLSHSTQRRRGVVHPTKLEHSTSCFGRHPVPGFAVNVCGSDYFPLRSIAHAGHRFRYFGAFRVQKDIVLERGHEYPTPELEAVLGKTLGVPLFQESAMRVAMVCAGFTGGEADHLRKSMATFKFTGGVSRFRDQLVSGMVKNAIHPRICRKDLLAARRLRQLRFSGQDAGARRTGRPSPRSSRRVSSILSIRLPMTSTLTAIANGHKHRQIEGLLPWNYSLA